MDGDLSPRQQARNLIYFRAYGHHLKLIESREVGPMKKRERDVIDSFYEEGEIDYIFFAQIIAAVSYDENDIDLSKSVGRKLSDVRILLDYIVGNGDFKLGKSITNCDGSVEYIELDSNIDDFLKELRVSINEHGIDSIDVNYGFWIRKVKGRVADCPIPKIIKTIFS
ncbi:hypothetical protein [Ochrobactrum sp. BTU1]|uniref:hypothetical protein n=1 Tax=Ochrobactrum sp. BTU1 TaxID=2840456 RepID=UPI001C05BCA3|nr:hypothetical protein KMS41_23405 [Ochrobactrum sp. BTU1]